MALPRRYAALLIAIAMLLFMMPRVSNVRTQCYANAMPRCRFTMLPRYARVPRQCRNVRMFR